MRRRAWLTGILFACCLVPLVRHAAIAQSTAPADQQYRLTCAGCHGLDGRGTGKGADIAGQPKIVALSDADLARIIHDGVPGKSMPAMAALGDEKIARLVQYLREMQKQAAKAPSAAGVTAHDQDSVVALTPKESSAVSKALTDADRMALNAIDVQPADVAQKTLADNWTSYHGDYSGRRFSSLDQITTANAAKLKPAWRLHTQNAGTMEATPVVANGVMYVTRSNDAYAIDARTGKLLWHHARAVTDGLVDDASGHINRGVAVLGTRVYMETDNAHLLCLDARTGEQLWDVAYTSGNKNYGATSAPLIVKDKVLVSASGGDDGVRGFLAAFDPLNGKELWRFWSIPAPGEKGHESWPGDMYLHGGGAMWMPGTYDPELNTLYWGTGNPAPDFNGSYRPGDDLYTCSLVALDPDTGKMKWHFQYSPHNLFDYDSNQTPVLVDAPFAGKPRKLVVVANRNGFLYILDRATGEYLASKQFIPLLNWAKGIDARGRPISSDVVPDEKGVLVCPTVDGGSNWYSPTYDPLTNTFYFRSNESCTIVQAQPDRFGEGEEYYGGGTSRVPDSMGAYAASNSWINAFSLDTLDFAWRDQLTEGFAWAGVMSTAGGTVIFGNNKGELEIVDAKTGKHLWSGALGAGMHSSPMSYAAGGKQYLAVTAGDDVVAFALPY